MAKKPAPTNAINPLLTDPEIHADLKPLFDAVAMVCVWSIAIARCYPRLLALNESRGLPKPEEWPDSPALERNRAQYAEWAKAAREVCAARGGSMTIPDFLEPRWTELMREWSGYYRDWCAAIAKAKELAKSPAVAAIMDAGEARPTHRWTTQTIIDLDNLAALLHPISGGGVDGLGFIRCGLPPLHTDFPARSEAVRKRHGELRSIPVSAAPPTPTVSVPPTALPGGVALTADHESILAVLGKTPTKCKTVIDVSSAGTIRNRETVGRLLGELAGFELVDRPHGKRKGYALTDAGRKRLPGATPT